jgi:hypothetical protein
MLKSMSMEMLSSMDIRIGSYFTSSLIFPDDKENISPTEFGKIAAYITSTRDVAVSLMA